MAKTSGAINPKTISILGCGWYGLELAKALVCEGHLVKGSATTIEKLARLSEHCIEPFLIRFEKEEENYDPLFFYADILFICIPPKRMEGQPSDYPHKIQRIINAAKLHQTPNLVFISSTSVYGDVNAEVTELSKPYPESESGKAILEAECLFQNLEGPISTIIRFAGLIGPQRAPGKFFAAKSNIPNGQAPVNLIHLTDCVGISLNLIRQQSFGCIINACCPHHPSRQDFYTAATAKANLVLPVFKDELLNWKLVSSIHASMLKYTFQITDWTTWLNENTND